MTQQLTLISPPPAPPTAPPEHCGRCQGKMTAERYLSEVEHKCINCGHRWRPPPDPKQTRAVKRNPFVTEARKLRRNRRDREQPRLLVMPRKRGKRKAKNRAKAKSRR